LTELLRDLVLTGSPSFVRELVFSQESDLPTLDTKTVLLEVDAGLMSFQHVETEEKVDVRTLEYSE